MFSNASLTRMISRFRDKLDEPTTSDKYSDSAVLELFRESLPVVAREVTSGGTMQSLVRHEITIVDDQEEYVLPPTVGELEAVELLNSEGNPIGEITPRKPWSLLGFGYDLQGNMLRVEPKLKGNGGSFRVFYHPTGDWGLHQGTGVFLASTTSGTGATEALTHCLGITLAASPTVGVLDTRQNAYAGALLRILTATGDWGEDAAITQTLVQVRTILSYDYTTRKVTFAPTLNPLPGWENGGSFALLSSGACTYEVIPTYLEVFDSVLVHNAILGVLETLGDTPRYKLAMQEYGRKMRALRLSVARAQLRGNMNMDRTLGRSR